jgi:hypothetical protein
MGTKKKIMYNVCYCPALACKRHRTFGHIFLKLKNLKHMRVNSLRSLVANTRLP